jgi:hypothetical protein
MTESSPTQEHPPPTQNETTRNNSTTRNTKLNIKKQNDKVRTTVHIETQFKNDLSNTRAITINSHFILQQKEFHIQNTEPNNKKQDDNLHHGIISILIHL